MLAVKVLRGKEQVSELRISRRRLANAREADVRVGDLVGEEKRTSDSAAWWVVRIREDSRGAHSREGGEGEGHLVRVHPRLRQLSAEQDDKVKWSANCSVARQRAEEAHRNFMLPSTLRRASRLAPYGAPGVLSSM